MVGVVNVLGISSSPRLDGNSKLLMDAVLEGAEQSGHTVGSAYLVNAIAGHLRDCRTCRGPDGSCSIQDGYAQLLLERVLPADAIVIATPLYWYGVSGLLKTFLDRIFCFTSAGYNDSQMVLERLPRKRLALVISAEESYRGATLGVTASVQELARYLHWDLVGVVEGVANRRGEVRLDPGRPIERARALGERLFTARVTDYRLDTERSAAVWEPDS
ncbi:MAG TPA: flavodoxin family protein [Solirubrobacteraceae bacterium]|nr:flavodoxin family protein [Solirubrobacteraceae bacterium]